MNNHLFLAPGDLTQISADAIAYSASTYLGRDGSLYSSFESQVPGFEKWITRLRKQHGEDCKVGDSFWMPLKQIHPPHGVVVTGCPDSAAQVAAPTKFRESAVGTTRTS